MNANIFHHTQKIWNDNWIKIGSCEPTLSTFRLHIQKSYWPISIFHIKLNIPFVSAFHLSRRVSDENRACSISVRFFKITDPFAGPFDGRSFLVCSHDPFFGTNKNRILKNGSCEQALTLALIFATIAGIFLTIASCSSRLERAFFFQHCNL